MPLMDTSPDAQARQMTVLRSLSGEQRVLLAYEMSMFVRDLAKAGIRSDHPDWDNDQVQRELLRRAFWPSPLPAQLK